MNLMPKFANCLYKGRKIGNNIEDENLNNKITLDNANILKFIFFFIYIKNMFIKINWIIVLMLSYPHDEVGNAFLTYDKLDEKGININQ